MPMLSLIIPVYNVEQYLAECLDSVFAQNIESMEVICVNDGSTDGSLGILERYAKQYSNLRIIIQPNGGLSAARNTGIRAAQGKWIVFLDSDDWLYPDCLNKAVAVAESRSVDVLSVNMLENGTKPYFPLDTYINEVYDSNGFMQEFFKQVHIYYMTPSVMYVYLRSFLQNNNLYFAEGIYHEDVEFVPRMLYVAQRMSLCNVPLTCYRIAREGSITNTRNMKRFTDQLWIYRHLCEYFAYKEDAMILRGMLWWIGVQALQYGKSIQADLSVFSKVDIRCLQRYASNRFEYRIARLMRYSKQVALLYFEQRLPWFVKKVINKLLPASQYKN